MLQTLWTNILAAMSSWCLFIPEIVWFSHKWPQEGAGMDATELFEDAHHSAQAESMLNDFYIGDVAD
jgi:hypothetical protein